MLGCVVPGPIVTLRKALAGLAAAPSEQEERLHGAVVRDELALDFSYAYEALASLPDAYALDGNTLTELRTLYAKFSVAADDSLWSESLNSPRWASIRMLARGLIGRV
jgi:hypothetical protein